jgi:Holliday junction resolvasome RuvABC endonuclease subunit
MEIIRVAGIDPGLRTSGYGIVNYHVENNEVWSSNCGVIRTPEKIKGIEAILFMIESLRKVSERESFEDCAKVVIEFPAAFYNPKFSAGSLTPLAAVSGACMAMFQNDNKDRIVPVYPVTWNGGKKKEKMSQLIQTLIGDYSEWEFDELPKREADFEHVIDAIGMSYWLLDKDYFESSKTGKECLNIQKKKKSGLN